MAQSDYERILKVSFLTGSSQLVTMGCTFFRMKIAALCFGTQGVGMLGLFNQSTGFIGAIAGLGLNSSAIREIAAAEGSGDLEKLSRVVTSVRRLVLATGLLAILICIAFSSLLSYFTFGDRTQTFSFALLGFALFFTEISNGQAALLRGLGRVRELAIQAVSVAVITTIVSGLLYWHWGVDGIVPSLIAGSCIMLLGSWWVVRNIEIKKISMSLKETLFEGREMLVIGLTFVWSSLLSGLCMLATGIIIRHYLGLEGNGLFQAAWGLSGLFAGLVVSSMGQDFFPRLTKLINQHQRACQLINEQTEVSILLALPGVVGTIALSKWMILLFYSNEFLPAAEPVTFFCIGCFLRIVAWPLSFVLIAKGNSLLVSVGEGLFWALYFLFAWIGLILYGLLGIAAGFAMAYLCYALGMRFCMARVIDFKYTNSNIYLLLISLLSLVFASLAGTVLGLLLTIGVSFFCLRRIIFMLGLNHPLVGKLLSIPFLKYLLLKKIEEFLKK